MSPHSFAKRLINGGMSSTRVAIVANTPEETIASMTPATRIGLMAVVRANARSHGRSSARRSAHEKNLANMSAVCSRQDGLPERNARAVSFVISGFIRTAIIINYSCRSNTAHKDRPLSMRETIGHSSLKQGQRMGRPAFSRMPAAHKTKAATTIHTRREKGEHISQQTPSF